MRRRRHSFAHNNQFLNWTDLLGAGIVDEVDGIVLDTLDKPCGAHSSGPFLYLDPALYGKRVQVCILWYVAFEHEAKSFGFSEARDLVGQCCAKRGITNASEKAVQ